MTIVSGVEYKTFIEKVAALSNDHFLQQEAVRLCAEQLNLSIVPIFIEGLHYYISQDAYYQIIDELNKPAESAAVTHLSASILLTRALGCINTTPQMLASAFALKANWLGQILFQSLIHEYQPKPIIIDGRTVWLPEFLYQYLYAIRPTKSKYAAFVLARALNLPLYCSLRDAPIGTSTTKHAYHTAEQAIADHRNWIISGDDYLVFFRITGEGFEAYLSEAQYATMHAMYQIRRYDEMREMLDTFLRIIPPTYIVGRVSLYDICTKKENWEDENGQMPKPALPQDKMPLALGVKYKLVASGGQDCHIDQALYIQIRRLLPRPGGTMLAAHMLAQATGIPLATADDIVWNEASWKENPPIVTRNTKPPIAPSSADI